MRTGENIFKRKDGRWEARYYKGRDASGKLLYGYCYGKTYTEAKAKAEQARRTQPWLSEAGGAGKHKTFGEFCDAWLQVNQPKLHASTCAKYQTVLARHIKPYFGGFRPTEISAQTVSSFSQHLLQERHLAPKTVKDILLILHSILQYTCQQCPGMPVIEIVYPRDTQTKIRVLSENEQKILTNYLLSDLDCCKFGVLLSLMTGLRIGELCALRRCDLSLEEGLLQVDATMQRVRANAAETGAQTIVTIGPPKSLASVRSIPLTAQIAELCRSLLPEASEVYLLTGTERYMEPRTLQYRFQRYAEACGLEDVHFHTLRHTFATRCIEAGVDAKTLSELLGHSSATITMNRYVHCSMDMKRRNLEKLSLLEIG